MFSINSDNNNAKSIMGIPISMTGMESGMGLLYDGRSKNWVPSTIAGPSSVSRLTDLTDCTITSIAENQVLQANANGIFINSTLPGTVSELNDLTDCTVTSVAENHVLKANSTGTFVNTLPYSYCIGSSAAYVGNSIVGQLTSQQETIWWNNVSATSWVVGTDSVSGTSNYFSTPTAGMYQITCQVLVYPTASSDRHVILQLNNYDSGADLAQCDTLIGATTGGGTVQRRTLSITKTMYLDPSTKLSFSISSDVDSVGNLDGLFISNETVHNYFSIIKIDI
jgi:hypothetical protein